jgi:hypothetical protein
MVDYLRHLGRFVNAKDRLRSAPRDLVTMQLNADDDDVSCWRCEFRGGWTARLTFNVARDGNVTGVRIESKMNNDSDACKHDKRTSSRQLSFVDEDVLTQLLWDVRSIVVRSDHINDSSTSSSSSSVYRFVIASVIVMALIAYSFSGGNSTDIEFGGRLHDEHSLDTLRAELSLVSAAQFNAVVNRHRSGARVALSIGGTRALDVSKRLGDALVVAAHCRSTWSPESDVGLRESTLRMLDGSCECAVQRVVVDALLSSETQAHLKKILEGGVGHVPDWQRVLFVLVFPQADAVERSQLSKYVDVERARDDILTLLYQHWST